MTKIVDLEAKAKAQDWWYSDYRKCWCRVVVEGNDETVEYADTAQEACEKDDK